MPNDEDLEQSLEGLDGKGYRAYKRIGGRYEFPGFELLVDHVQGDPFADPSRMRILAPPGTTGIPEDLLRSDTRRTALADYLNRVLVRELARHETGEGSGKSGALIVLRPGQAVLKRSAVTVWPDGAVEVRIRVGLPAKGRTILGREAARLVCRAVPAAVEASLAFTALEADDVYRHVLAVEDARALRNQLRERGLVSFVANGSVLPRRSGIDDRPLKGKGVVPFESPESLRVTLATPNAGELAGMGIPRGVTLLVGGGFHGKSTLLRAVERGVYDHAAGDGRERVVTVEDAVKVRAEDGRSVAGTDISNFIGGLPGGVATNRFSTENASGSTSQAAAIAEALEVGTSCLLLDEDTSATNFLIRDARVQALISKGHEPITPLIDRARQIHEELGVSLLLVVGGSGDYFEVADTVVAMRDYRPHDVTDEAAALVERYPTRRSDEGGPWREPSTRRPDPGSIDPRRGRRERALRAFGTDTLEFGTTRIEVSAVEQLVEEAQLRAIGRAVAVGAGGCIDGSATIREATECVMREMTEHGLDRLDRHPLGDMAEFRPHELAAVLNRLRTLRCA